MQILFDLFPILLFFAAYKITADLILATAVAMVFSLLQLLIFRIKHGHYNKTQLISFISILILGGATILLRDELYIKWKPTVVYWLLALILLINHFLGKKPIIKMLIAGNINLPEQVWKQLNFSWALFCAGMGIINLVVIYNFNTATWVNFKLFGTLGLTGLFVIMQGIVISKFLRATTE